MCPFSSRRRKIVLSLLLLSGLFLPIILIYKWGLSFNINIFEDTQKLIISNNDPEVFEADDNSSNEITDNRADNVAEKKAMIMIYAESDVCHIWREHFPGYVIVIVGPKLLGNQEGCIYVEHDHNSMKHLKLATMMEMSEVSIVEHSNAALGCVNHVTKRSAIKRRYKVVYSLSKTDQYYTGRKHWGCGGATAVDDTSKYSLCPDEGHPGVIISTRDQTHKSCDMVYSIMALGTNTYVVMSPQCAWIQQSAFPVLAFLEPSNKLCQSGKCELALRMTYQKLVWQLGTNIEVTSDPNGILSEEIESESADTIHKMAATLSNITCAATSWFSDCVRQILLAVQQDGDISAETIKILMNWLQSWTPQKVSSSLLANCSSIAMQSFQSDEDFMRKDMEPNLNQRKQLQLQTCKNRRPQEHVQEPWKQWRDILLIVTYNTAKHYSTIPYYEAIYRQFFPHILYCGPGMPDKSDPALANISYVFVSYGNTPKSLRSTEGALHYQCFVMATGMGFNVSGYMETSDDIIMFPHMLKHFNTSKAWYWKLSNTVKVDGAKHRSCDDDGCRSDNRNGNFWHKFRPAVGKAIAELNSDSTDPANICNENRNKLFGGPSWHVRTISDFYYIPARFADDISYLLSIFIRNKVYLEIAIPTVVHCLIPQDQIDHIFFFLQNYRNPSKDYSPDKMEPSEPDVGVLSILDKNILRGPGPRAGIYNYVVPKYLNGVAHGHPHKLGYAEKEGSRDQQFYCDIIGFFSDPTGNAKKYLS